MNFNEDEMADMTINYDKITKEKSFLSCTRLLAAQLIVNPYMTVKDFLLGLSDADLQMLVIIADSEFKDGQEVDAPEKNHSDHLADILLMSQMLARAEGIVAETITEIQQHTNAMCTFITLESLARKGLVDVFRENFSFGEDMQTKMIAKAKAGE